MRLIKLIVPVILIAIVFLFIARPALHGGLFISDDDVQITRTMAMVTELKSGQFPVRYIDSFGNGGGYFLFNFYSPLVYYLSSTLVLLGLSFFQAVKLVFLGVLAVGALGMFLLIKSKTNLSIATIGTILFLLSPYVFHDLFHRGALAESAAFLFSPFTVWSYLQLFQKKHLRTYFLLSVVSFASVITSHILTGALLGLVLLGWLGIVWLRQKNLKVTVYYLSSLVLATTLSGFYFFPMIIENHLTRYEQTNFVKYGYLDKFVEPWQQFGLGGSITNKQSFLGMGLITTLLVLTGVLLSTQVKNKLIKMELKFITIIAWLSLFLMSSWSSFIWSHLVYLRYFQFPYRLLTITTILLVFGFAMILDQIKNWRLRLTLIVAVLIIPLVWYLPYYSALGYQYVAEYKVEGKCKTTAWEDEHFPRQVEDCLPSGFNEPIAKSLTENLVIKKIETEKNNRVIKLTVTGGPGTIQVHKYAFPGWKVSATSGESFTIEPTTKYGLISFNLPALNKTSDEVIEVILGNTWIRTWGNWSTILTLLVLIWIWCLWSRIAQIFDPATTNKDATT